VLRSGRPEFYPEITDAMLVESAKDERSLELSRSIGFSSAMIVPLVGRAAPVGTITFVTAESGRRYTAADLAMAEELAGRAALAIENSRLYGESQSAVALRDDFIAAASHELRTPVTSLRVYTEVLQRRAAKRGDDHTSLHLGKMTAQIERLAVLIDDLLDVSKIEAGKLELRRDTLDLRRMVDEVAEAVEGHIRPAPDHGRWSPGSGRRGRPRPARSGAHQPPDQRRQVLAGCGSGRGPAGRRG
jgi:signal transduction histidine kinase